MVVSVARHILRISARQTGRSVRAPTPHENNHASCVLWRAIHTKTEVDAAKESFFNTFESDDSLRGEVVYSLAFTNDHLDTDLASDDTYPLLDDIMMRQLLNSYSTYSLPSSSTVREIRDKLPPHLNLSNLEPFDLDAKDSLPNLEGSISVTVPSAYNQPLPKTIHDINPSKLDEEARAIVVTDIKSPFYITQVNTAWESLCGYKREECKGKSLGPLLQGPDTDSIVVSALLSNLLAGDDASAVLTNYTKCGRRFRNLVRVGSIRDEMGKTVNFVGVLRELKDNADDANEKNDRPRKETSELPFVS